VSGPRIVRLPLAFALPPGRDWRLAVEYRASAGAQAALALLPDAPPEGDARLAAALARGGLPGARGFRTLEDGAARRSGVRKTAWDFRTAEGAPHSPALVVASGSVEIAGLRLRRRMAHPFDSQLAFYLGRLARLDLGFSSREQARVATLLREGIGPSLALTVPIFAIGFALALGLALVCAWFRDTWIDRAFVVASVALMSVNYLVWIVLGQYLLGFRLGWFPVWGFESWAYLALPVLVGVVTGLGPDVRFFRTVLLDEMYRDYVRTARAKGAGPARVLFVHVLRNAMIPVLTHVALSVPFLYTGSLLLEGFFGIPGLGYVGVNAIHSADPDVVRAVVLVGSVLYMAANLLTDVAYAAADPRVKLA
jgi:peptide/nickel transport system permease protein